jgi:hypothetical protein
MRKVSQGMLGVFAGRGGMEAWGLEQRRAELWNDVAPILEKAWAVNGERQRVRCEGLEVASEEEAEALLALAEAAGLCSFAQTIEAARKFLLERDGARMLALVRKALDERLPFEAIRALTLNVVDEGHTAAVVRAEISLTSRPTLVIALLVARDLGAAASRLGAQASDLRVWHRMSPRRAAEILEDGTGGIRWFGQLREVPVIAARWIEGETLYPTVFEEPDEDPPRRRFAVGTRDRLELRAPPRPGDPDEPDDRDDREQARSSGPTGTASARREIEARCGERGERAVLTMCLARQLAELRSALATFAPDGACERMIDLDQGNAMLDRQGTVVLVGSAARSWWGALGAWPYRLAAAMVSGSTTAPRPLVAEAVLAGLATVARRPDGDAIASVMLQQAGDPDLARRALDGLLPPAARDATIASVQSLLPSALAQLLRRPATP